MGRSAFRDTPSLSVRVHADDPISREGVRVQLELDEGVRVVPDVGGIVRRHQATAEQLGQAARTIAGGRPHRLLPKRLASSGLSDREIEVLRLVAEGCDTAEIAVHLSYSERTIKGILHDVKTRLHLRNRTHAVTYAMREGLL
jgi:DNA-binding NarL/FixJ family response regulator